MKKVFSLLLCFVLTLGCSFNCFAAEKAGEIKSNNLPHNGAEHFVVEVRVTMTRIKRDFQSLLQYMDMTILKVALKVAVGETARVAAALLQVQR